MSDPLLCWNEEGVFAAVTPHTAPDTEQSLYLLIISAFKVSAFMQWPEGNKLFDFMSFASVPVMLLMIASNEKPGPLIPPSTAWLGFQSGCSACCNDLAYALLHPLRCFFPLPSLNTNTGTTRPSGISLFDLHHIQKG